MALRSCVLRDGKSLMSGLLASRRPISSQGGSGRCGVRARAMVSASTAQSKSAEKATEEARSVGQRNQNLRNVALVAHVDHGKTSLVDAMLKQSDAFKGDGKGVTDRVMDSNDLERERGITILSKQTAITYKGTKINLVDTPGHADFGGEVERVLSMVDAVLLLIDAVEGPMPQTRFVLQKALDLGHKVIVVINKVDREGADTDRVLNDTFDLFCELGADDDQCDFPAVYASGLRGVAGDGANNLGDDLDPLFTCLINEVEPPNVDMDAPTQMYVTSTEYDDYKGRMGVGRVRAGSLARNQQVSVGTDETAARNAKVDTVYVFENFSRVEVGSAGAGDLCTFTGVSDIKIGETVYDKDNGYALPGMQVEEPSVSITMQVNVSPFAGKEGKFVTSRQLKDRLGKEVERNVAMRLEESSAAEEFVVKGRGTLHLSVLVETMRREGYEFQLAPPQVIYRRDEDSNLLEPYEEVHLEVPEDYSGACIDILGTRLGEMKYMGPANVSGATKITYLAPSRALVGLRNSLLTATKGTALLSTNLHGYGKYAGKVPARENGSLLAHETGQVTAYALESAQERGALFVQPQDEVYENQIVGQHQRPGDLKVNVCRKKELTNQRASGSEKNERLDSKKELSLDDCIEYIGPDELVEATPACVRLCKNPKMGKKGKK